MTGILEWIVNEASRGLDEGDTREALTTIKWKVKDAIGAAPTEISDADLGDLSKHAMNCGWYGDIGNAGCTCSLKLRVALKTEREMHRAWRKRAEEAEAAIAAQKASRAALADSFPEVNLSNYTDDDVSALNSWGFEVVDALRAAEPQS